MPTTPTDRCAARLRVLGNEIRFRIVGELLGMPRTVAVLRRRLDLEPSLLSHHLQTLRADGLIEGRRVGRHVRYRLAPGLLAKDEANTLDFGCCQVKFAPRTFPNEV
jgi:ArsR family transcriptional regulator